MISNSGDDTNNSVYQLLKQGQGKESFSLNDLSNMIGLPVEMIKEQLNLTEDSITLDQLQEKTRQLVNDYFIDENKQ